MNHMQKVRKAVIPAAGLGTRFLPATKAIAKEMLPIIDIPALQYQVKEAVDSGVEEVILIISKGKEEIKKHFDRNEAYEEFLHEKGKDDFAKIIKDIALMAKVTYVYQDEQKGLGHAILCAEKACKNEPFIVILGDDLTINEGGKPVSKQMIELYEKTGSSVIGCQEVAWSEVSKYGIISLEGEIKNRVGILKGLVEKPKQENAPSRLACLGRYLFTPEIFVELAKVKPSLGGEILLTDAIETLARKEKVLAYDFVGRRYDVGDKYGYVEAIIDFALKRDDLKDKVLRHLEEISKNKKEVG
jgi:UTP--glucose-1-phosphate uridylyltransferase